MLFNFSTHSNTHTRYQAHARTSLTGYFELLSKNQKPGQGKRWGSGINICECKYNFL